MKFGFHAYAILNMIENLTRAYKTYYFYISFDGEFYKDFEFLFKIVIPPTHFEKSPILNFCVGGLKKFLSHQIKNFIWSHNICVFRMIYVQKNRI